MECHRATVTCNYCGKEIHRGKALLTRHLKDQTARKIKSKGNYYCDRKCFGAKMGQTVGFRAHPEHASGLSKGFTEEQIAEMQKMKRGGAKIREIGRRFNICASTVYKYLKTNDEQF
jgi:DNA-binding NarL/FixJ family response regulator